MLFINKITYQFPSKRILIDNMHAYTQLSPDVVSVLKKFYGLNEVLVCDDISIVDLVCASVNKMLLSLSGDEIKNIKYVIYVHTSQLLVLFGCSIAQQIKERFNLHHAITFGTTQHKCASAIRSIDLLQTLLNPNEKSSALVVTGEIAFSPDLRVTQGNSISGDVSTAILVSHEGSDHAYIASELTLLSNYYKGIYLPESEFNKLDADFLNAMKYTIEKALIKAEINLSDIALILPNNVHLFAWKKIATLLGISIDRVYTDNISKLGHCFSSDGILNLAMAQENNRLKKDDYYLMIGCGLGIFIMCAVFRY